ncbi:MAG TPA: hypothetical protein VD866_19110 [Urbifossiella sp.]|nr:hypothetical protein [Urbifossiella sp.]
MDDPILPTGPLPDEPEAAVPGAIAELLRRVPPDEAAQRRAFALLQRYRGEALAAVTRCTDVGARRHAVAASRAMLRQRLLALLSESSEPTRPSETADPEALRSRLVDPDLARTEREYRAAYEREVAEARQRLQVTHAGLLAHEVRLHRLDGMSPPAAEAAARANLALRVRGMEEELRSLTAYHRDRYLGRLRELAAMQEDQWADGE